MDTNLPCNPLRRDLSSKPVREGERDQRLVIDGIAGRFTRVSEHLWQSLLHSQWTPALLQQAHQAGWLRTRTTNCTRIINPLAFQVRLGSIDSLARALGVGSHLFFSPIAILGWSLFCGVAMIVAMSHATHLRDAATTLPSFLSTTSALTLIFVFVTSKLAHELAHAVACRHIGARCGDIGIYFFCGTPCPYCDVTDIWRIPSPFSRMGVMLAGIYVELILASFCLWGWLLSRDAHWQSFFLYAMFVCSISTLVFNANPLVRYDGYHVLSEWVGTANLRAESRETSIRLLDSFVSKEKRFRRELVSLSRRACGFILYDSISTIYRVLISLAIVTFLVLVAGQFHLRSVAIVVAIAWMMRLAIGQASTLIRFVTGQGRWRDSSTLRRYLVTGAGGLLILGVLFFPLPRSREQLGRITPVDQTVVYVRSDGIVASISAEFGQRVTVGDLLATIEHPESKIQVAQTQGQLRLASLRRKNAETSAIDRPDVANQWELLRAAESALETSLVSANESLRGCHVTAPITGVLLPVETEDPQSQPAGRLALRRGLPMNRDAPWCRIVATTKRNAIIRVDAAEQSHVTLGTAVTLQDLATGEIYATTVTSISPVIQATAPNATAFFEAICPLPGDTADLDPILIESDCLALIHLPARMLSEDLVSWFMVWLRA